MIVFGLLHTNPKNVISITFQDSEVSSFIQIQLVIYYISYIPSFFVLATLG